MNKILGTLYQGNAEDAILASQDKSVDWIIYLGQELPEKLGFNSPVPIIHIPVNDRDDNINKWKIANEVISSCRSKICCNTLIACRQGISRSPMMLVYYTMRNHLLFGNFDSASQEFAAACNFVKVRIAEFRPDPRLFEMIKKELIA